MREIGQSPLRTGELFSAVAVYVSSCASCSRILFSVLFVLLSVSGFGQSPATNVQILKEAMSGVVDQSMERCGLDPGDTVSVSFAKESDALSVFAGNAFLEGLQDRGVRVVIAEDSAWAACFLDIVVTNAGVAYPRASRSGLFGKRWFDRRALVGVSLKAVDAGTRGLLYAGNLESRVEDRVPTNAVDTIEGDFLLGRPVRPAMTGTGRWLEPILAVGVFMGAASLFYFIRSG